MLTSLRNDEGEAAQECDELHVTVYAKRWNETDEVILLPCRPRKKFVLVVLRHAPSLVQIVFNMVSVLLHENASLECHVQWCADASLEVEVRLFFATLPCSKTAVLTFERPGWLEWNSLSHEAWNVWETHKLNQNVGIRPGAPA